MRIKATIKYKMKPSHPDYKCVVGGYTPGKVMTFTDVYTFRDELQFTADDVKGYIKSDLKTVAGGGYDSKGIYDYSFSFERV